MNLESIIGTAIVRCKQKIDEVTAAEQKLWHLGAIVRPKQG